MIFFVHSVFASDLAVTFNVSHYQNGNNISCHGVTDGMVEAVIVGGNAPYTYSWNTGSFNRVLTGIAAGSYTFTVTDAASVTVSATIEIIEPQLLEITLLPSLFGGYNISNQAGHDGELISDVKGGAPPYAYAWSTGATTENIYELGAGFYNIVLTDANGCTKSASKTMTEPTPLHVVSITSPLHNGFNISCKGGSDGAINLTVDGGVPPYKFDWNTGSFNEDISELAAREYSVRITDDNNAKIVTSIILTQPSGSLKVELTPQVYSNGFNLSCHDCANGSLTAIGIGGVAPFSFLWSNSLSTATISGLQAIDYNCIITDANGCKDSRSITLNSPERDDWSMNGNTGTNPLTQFIGTTDSIDVVLKTNNSERIKLQRNGDVKIRGNIKLDSLNSDSVQAVFVDPHGNLRRGPGGSEQQLCFQPMYAFYKKLCTPTPDYNYYFFGGNTGISKLVLGNPAGTPGTYKLYVTGGILTEKLRIADPTTNFWADYVFDKNYKLKSLQEIKEFISINKHLPDIPTTKEVQMNGIDVLEIQGKLLQKIEELTLHLIAQDERIKELENQLTVNEK